MSTIKSSSEHLTLNADGALKDIILQNNGSTKVTVKSDGNVGIGTTSPSGSGWAGNAKAFHIYQNDTQGSLIKLESSNTVGVLAASNNAFHIATVTDDPIILFTNGTEKLRIQSGGDVKVNTGNLVIGTAGKGIDFSAQTSTTATGAAASSGGEVLDHYEEGTFTPTVSLGSASTNSYSQQYGAYTKVGNLVSFSIQVVCSTSGTPGVDQVVILGLPFARSATITPSDGEWGIPIMTRNNSGAQSLAEFVGLIRSGLSDILFTNWKGDSNQSNEVGIGTNTKFTIQGHYFT